MMHFELLDIALIGGVPAAVILTVLLAFKLTKGRPVGKITFGPVSGLTVVATILLLCWGGVATAWHSSRSIVFPFPFPLILAGQMIQAVAGRMRSAALGRILEGVGAVVQAVTIVVFAYCLFGLEKTKPFAPLAVPVILALACLGVLLGKARAPAWRTVGLLAALAISLAVVITLASGANWPMTLVWLALASGPIAVAWLRARAAAPNPNDTPPPAMEPTA